MSMRDRIARALADGWFGKSVVKDPAGNPLQVFRGEHGEPGEELFQSKLGSLTFGDARTASHYAMDPNDPRMYPEAPRVTPGFLKIENPIVNYGGDPFIELGHLADRLGPEEARRIAEKFDPHIRATGHWDENYYRKYDDVPHLLREKPDALRDLYFETYKYLDDPAEVAILKKHGYDGAVHQGVGENYDQMEYRIFDPSQFRTSIKGLAAAPIGGVFAQDQYGAPQP